MFARLRWATLVALVINCSGDANRTSEFSSSTTFRFFVSVFPSPLESPTPMAHVFAEPCSDWPKTYRLRGGARLECFQ